MGLEDLIRKEWIFQRNIDQDQRNNRDHDDQYCTDEFPVQPCDEQFDAEDPGLENPGVENPPTGDLMGMSLGFVVMMVVLSAMALVILLPKKVYKK